MVPSACITLDAFSSDNPSEASCSHHLGMDDINHKKALVNEYSCSDTEILSSQDIFINHLLSDESLATMRRIRAQDLKYSNQEHLYLGEKPNHCVSCLVPQREFP